MEEKFKKGLKEIEDIKLGNGKAEMVDSGRGGVKGVNGKGIH
jgi:hypothetical protein